MVVHGYAGATYDLDIVFERSRENLSRLVQALSPYHPRPRDFDDALPFVFDAVTLQNNSALTLKTDLGAIDLFAEIPGFKTYGEIEKAAESIDLGNGVLIKILTVDGLIVNKTATGRKKDIDHLQHLRAIKDAQKP